MRCGQWCGAMPNIMKNFHNYYILAQSLWSVLHGPNTHYIYCTCTHCHLYLKSVMGSRHYDKKDAKIIQITFINTTFWYRAKICFKGTRPPLYICTYSLYQIWKESVKASTGMHDDKKMSKSDERRQIGTFWHRAKTYFMHKPVIWGVSMRFGESLQDSVRYSKIWWA